MSEKKNLKQLTLSSVAPHVSRLVEPGSKKAQQMTAISGRKCLELFQNSNQLGLFSRMLLASSIYFSTKRYLKWKPKGTPAKRLYFQLVPSTPPIDVIESSLWRTPCASDGEGGIMKTHKDKSGHYKLRDHVQEINQEFWPTPTANEDAAGTPNGKMQKMLGNHPDVRGSGIGTLNPAWVEWLMGFPIGWTDLKDSETP